MAWPCHKPKSKSTYVYGRPLSRKCISLSQFSNSTLAGVSYPTKQNSLDLPGNHWPPSQWCSFHVAVFNARKTHSCAKIPLEDWSTAYEAYTLPIHGFFPLNKGYQTCHQIVLLLSFDLVVTFPHIGMAPDNFRIQFRRGNR